MRMFRYPLATALAAAVALTLTGCGSATPADGPQQNGAGVRIDAADTSPLTGTVLTPPVRLADVTLTDTGKQSFQLRDDTTAPVTVVFFGYTHCPDVCPINAAQVAAALRGLDPSVRDQIQVLFITTDPKRDTPTVIRDWLNRFNPAFEGLTGPLPRIKKVASPLNVAVGPITTPSTGPPGSYDVTHSGQIFAFDRNDRSLVMWGSFSSVANIRADLLHLLRSDQTPGTSGSG